MGSVEFFAIISSVASIVVAVIAIWLALHQKKETDRTNIETRDLLLEIRSDAKSVSNIALPEMKAYGEAMRNYIFTSTEQERRVLTRATTDGGRRTSVAPVPVDDDNLIDALAAAASSVAEGDSYTPQQRNTAVRLLTKIEKAGLADDPVFPDLLETLLDAFAGSGQTRTIDLIDSLFSDVIVTHDGMVQTMLNFLGIKMLGGGIGAEKAKNTFLKYAEAAKELEMYPIAIAPLLVLERSSNNEPAVSEILEQLKQMDEVAITAVVEVLERRADPYKVQRRPDTETRAMAEKYRQFNSEYLETIAQMADPTFLAEAAAPAPAKKRRTRRK